MSYKVTQHWRQKGVSVTIASRLSTSELGYGVFDGAGAGRTSRTRTLPFLKRRQGSANMSLKLVAAACPPLRGVNTSSPAVSSHVGGFDPYCSKDDTRWDKGHLRDILYGVSI